MAAALFAALLFIVGASIQYLNGVRQSIATYRLVTATSQQMRLGSPYQSGSLMLGMWTARLLDMPWVSPVEGPQPLTGSGIFEMSFDSSQHPPVVEAYASRDLGLLSGFLGNISSGIGLGILTTSSKMFATSYESWVSVSGDVSVSMAGPWVWNNGQPSMIDNLLKAYKIPIDNDTTKPCYPIDVSDAANFVAAYREAMNPDTEALATALGWANNGAPGGHMYDGAPAAYNPTLAQLQRFVCNLRRQLLPGFTQNRARPTRLRYDLQRPDASNVNLTVPAPVFPQHWPTTSTTGDKFYRTYNPGIDYTFFGDTSTGSSQVPGDSMLVCNVDAPRVLPWCEPDKSGAGVHCFPLASLIQQFAMNYAGVRGPFWDYDMDNATYTSCTTSETSAVSKNDVRGCPPTFISYTDNDFCWYPWLHTGQWNLNPTTRFFYTEHEYNSCSGTNSGMPEIPGSGCQTQFNIVRQYFSDYWMIYKRLTQAFIIGLSDAIPLLEFFTIAAPTGWGPISNTVVDPSKQWGVTRAMGIEHLYSSYNSIKNYAGTGHVYQDSIDPYVLDLKDYQVNTSTGTFNISNFASFVGLSRFNEVLPHLEAGPAPKTTPIPGMWYNMNHPPRAGLSASAAAKLTPAGSTYYGAKYIAPVPHPQYPFVSGNYPYGTPDTHCATWELKEPGTSPAQYMTTQYNMNWLPDLNNNNEKRWVPSPVSPFIQDAPAPATLNYHSSYSDIYDWNPLRAIHYSVPTDPNDGKQVSPKVQYTEEDVRNLPMCIFDYMPVKTGGTDIWSAVESARRQFKYVRDDNNGKLKDIPGASVFITDGEPSLADADTSALTGAGLTPATIPTGPVSDPNSHLGKVASELDILDDKAFAILLFIKREATLSPNAQAFIDLFDNTTYPKRLSFVIDVQNATDFAQQFAQALSLIRLIVLGSTKFVL